MRTADHHLFFSATILGDRITLNADETRHAASVLRCKPGDPLRVTDGKGVIYNCKAATVEKDEIIASIVSRDPLPPPVPEVTCFIGLPERDAFEVALENLAPLGVSTIVPVICGFSQKPWWKPSWDVHRIRFQKKVVAGIKQSLNPWMPVLEEPLGFSEAINQCGMLSFCGDHEGIALSEVLAKKNQAETMSCFIGPPGGFTSEERSALKKKSVIFVKLSSYRLRSELAATVLCAAVMS
jgi:16S rRNA (uracil1498-N3)-methyltransferase